MYLLENLISACVAYAIMSVGNDFEICKILTTKCSNFGTFLLLFFLGQTTTLSQLKNNKYFKK